MSSFTANKATGAALTKETQSSVPAFQTNHGTSTQPGIDSNTHQAVIQASDLNHLRLTFWNMSELGLMNDHDQALVKRISLSLQLEGDTSHLWQPLRQKRQAQRATDCCVLVNALHDLFRLLGTWKPQGKLDLDISISSPRRQVPDPDVRVFGDAGQVLLGDESNIFLNEDWEKKWWETLPKVPAVTNLVMRVQHDQAWRPVTLENLVSRLPGLEEFRYENAPQDSKVVSSLTTAIHHSPSFSGKRWSKALAYYTRVQEQYFFDPEIAHYMATDFNPLRRPDSDCDSDSDSCLED